MKKNNRLATAWFMMILSVFLVMMISSCDFSDPDTATVSETQSEDYPDELIHGYWLNEDGVLYLHFEEEGDFTYHQRDVHVEGWFDLDGEGLILGFNDGSSYVGAFNYEEDTMAFVGLTGTFYRATEDMLPKEENNQQEDIENGGVTTTVDWIVGNWMAASDDVTYTFGADGSFSAQTPQDVLFAGTYSFDGEFLVMDIGDDHPLTGHYAQDEGVLYIDGHEGYFIYQETGGFDTPQPTFDTGMVGVWDNGNEVTVTFDEYGEYVIDSPVSSRYGTYMAEGTQLTMLDTNGMDIGAAYDPSDDSFWLEEFDWFYRASDPYRANSNEPAYAGVPVLGTWQSDSSGVMTTLHEDGTFYFQYSEGDSVTGTFTYNFSDESIVIYADRNGYDFSTGFHDLSDDTLYLEGWNWFYRVE